MAERDVVIVIVGKDKLSKVLSGIGKEAEKSGKKLEKSFADKIGDLGKKATKVGKALSIGLTAPLALAGAAAVSVAIKAERLEKTLIGLAGGAESAATFIDAIKDASLGTIPEVEALAIANRALSFGVVETADEMANLTEIAIALGRAQGLDAATAVSDLTTALSRQSPMILDNLGIIVKAGDANKAFAEKLGISTNALTTEQKAIAFRTAALEAGNKVVAKMGGLQDDMASSSERVKAQMSDLALTVGKALIPVMQSGIDIISPLIQKFTDMDSGMQKVVIAFAGLAAVAGPVLAFLGGLTTFIAALPAKLAAMNATLLASNPLFLALAAGAVAAVAAFAAYQKIAFEVEQGQKNVNAALETWSSIADEMIAKGGTQADVLAEFAERANEAAEAIDAGGIAADIFVNKQEVLGKVASEIGAEILRASATFEEYEQSVTAYNMSVTDSNLKVRTQVDVQKRVETILRKTGIAMTAADVIQLDFADSAIALTKAEFELATGTGAAANEVRRLETLEQNAAAATRILAEEQAALTAEQEALAVSSTEVALTQEQIAIAQKNANVVAMEYEQALIAQEEAQARLNEESIAAEQQLAARALSSANAAAREYEAALRADVEASAASKAAAEEQASALEASAQRQADALAIARDAANKNAEAFVNLSASLLDATEAQVAQALISQLDPEALGAEGFVTAVQGIQLAFGLADEKSIALAGNVGSLADALNDGTVPAEDAAAALVLMKDAAAEGVTDVGDLLAQFADAPGKIDPANEGIDRTNELLVAMGEVAPDAQGGMEDFQGAVNDAKTAVENILPQLGDMEADLLAISKTWPVTIEFITIGTPPPSGGGGNLPPNLPTRQFGGIVPGPIGGGPVPILAHPGEVILNPNQPGALGGPGGPSFGGDTFNITINNELAAAMFLSEQQRRRFDRLEARM